MSVSSINLSEIAEGIMLPEPNNTKTTNPIIIKNILAEKLFIFENFFCLDASLPLTDDTNWRLFVAAVSKDFSSSALYDISIIITHLP